ncbi:MAG: sigma-70 family RNA polymerase sigma factor [Chitinophagaceae bacterium]|nr:sigma-70 family RNA polymerase sigma factor [Chitinophagaceae bacterium]
MSGQNQYDVGKLITQYQPQLTSFIRKRIANKEDREDILQDVFYQLIQTVSIALHPIENVSAWLYRVARNRIINHRAKKREERLPEYRDEESDQEVLEEFSEVLFSNETSFSPETEYLRSLVWTELKSALAELPQEQREIYELTEFDGIPVKEIALSKDIAINTLLSRKHYAVLHLRKRMKQLYEDIIIA